MKNLGIIVDNEFNSDVRVRREVDILKRYGLKISILCFAFDKNSYPEVDGAKICRIELKKKQKIFCFFFLTESHCMS